VIYSRTMTPEQQQFLVSNGLAVVAWIAFGIFVWKQGWPFVRDQIVAMQTSFRQDMLDRKAEIALLIQNNQAQRDSHLAAERQSRSDYLASLENIRVAQNASVTGELKELRIAVVENTKTLHDWLANQQSWGGEEERRKPTRTRG
jgi:hypothetical protein